MADYPRGFLYSSRSAPPPPHWERSGLFPKLSHDGGWHRSAAETATARVEVLGHCVPVDRAIAETYSPAEDLIVHLEAGEDAFLQRLAMTCGRYVIFYATREGQERYGPPRMVADATGLRTIYHSVGPAQPSAGSHAGLVNAALAKPSESHPPPAKWGFPGRMTAYAKVRMLPPNQVFDLASGELTRFYPHRAPEPVDVDTAARQVLEMTRMATGNFHRRYGGLRLALTAGLDSRCNLAIAQAAGVPIDAFTYLHVDRAEVDCRIAAEICRPRGIAHRVLDISAYGKQGYRQALGQAMEAEGGWPTMLSSHLLEIGQAFYFARPLPHPDSAENAARLYFKMATRHMERTVEEYGRGAYKSLLSRAFAEFYDVTGFAEAARHIHPFDLFYWEHRMAAWQARNVLARDPGCDTFNPFNARVVLETLLGVPLADREACSVFWQLLEMVDPALVELPVNPEETPVA